MYWISFVAGVVRDSVFYVLACDRVGKLRDSSAKAFEKAGSEFFKHRAKLEELEKRCDELETALRRFMKDVDVPTEDDPRRPEDLELMISRKPVQPGPAFSDGRARK